MKTQLLFFLCLPFFAPLEACTGIQLTAKDGSTVHGRTLEFGTPVYPSVGVVPRGYAFKGTTPLGEGLSYKAKYGAVGAFLFDELVLLDGLNEKGLAIGTFFFPGFACYTPTTAANQANALSPVEFPNWILTQCATVEEVKALLPTIVIAPTLVKGWGNTPPPFHYIVYDKTGKSIVIEPLKETLIVYDNPLGVLTNSPSFDWHLTNLRNFVNLKAVNAAPSQLGSLELAPFGQGSGMLGLPGDFTPPSRFVRAAFFATTAEPSPDALSAVLQTFHILNQFDIPLGAARQVENGATYADYTMVTCARDPQNLKYYFKTYDDQTIQMIDLKSFDLSSSQIKKMTPSTTQLIRDVSSQLAP